MEENKIANLVKKGDPIIYIRHSVWQGTCYKLFHVKSVTKAGRVRIEETNELTNVYGGLPNNAHILPATPENLLKRNEHLLDTAVDYALDTLGTYASSLLRKSDAKEEIAKQVYVLLELVHREVIGDELETKINRDLERVKNLLNERDELKKSAE